MNLYDFQQIWEVSSSNLFSVPVFSFSSWTPVTNVTLFDMFPQVPRTLSPCPRSFFMFFKLDNFYLFVLMFTDCVILILLLSPSSEFFTSQIYFSFLKFSFDCFSHFLFLCRKQLFPITSRMFTFTSWSVVIIADLGSSLVILTSRLS